MNVQDEYIDHYNWLASLREPVRELVLCFWDETGRARHEHPVDDMLVALCKLNVESANQFYADARITLVKFDFIKEEELRRYFLLFTQGAIWGTITLQNMIRDELKSYPHSENP